MQDRAQRGGDRGGGGGGGRGRGRGRGRASSPHGPDAPPTALQAASPQAPPHLGAPALAAWDRWWTHMQAASADVGGENMTEPDFVADFVTWLHRAESDSGAILVFLTGLGDISKVHERLVRRLPESEAVVLPLHGSMATSNQRQIFNRPPPGVRKIVLATNIAETSITIDDVTVVVDCGVHKVMSYDTLNEIRQLSCQWCAPRCGDQGLVAALCAAVRISRGRHAG